jgi:23S rRNA (adenine2503-C2)-methyltransferase
MTSKKTNLLGMSLAELQQLCAVEGMPRFAAQQMCDWLYAKQVDSIDAMTNISLRSRARLKEIAFIGRHEPVNCQVSKDGTKKYLFRIENGEMRMENDPDAETNSQFPIPNSQLKNAEANSQFSIPNSQLKNAEANSQFSIPNSQLKNAEANSQFPIPNSQLNKYVEAVFIPDGDRGTLCVSCQMGCKMGCRFCVTGQQGFHGNLTAAEILNQIFSIPEFYRLTNIVYMGMGEPMDNLDNVLRSTEVLTASWGLGWSPHRITVSSVGIVPGLRRFLDVSQCHVAVSLHNPFAAERLDIMPMQRVYPIADVVALLRQYDWSGQRRISFEYTMFSGLNDDLRHAAELVRLLKGLYCRVNLIRFHASPDTPFKTSSAQAMERFKEYLNSHGITCTIRASRGEDIMAACGLLAGQATHAD